ncbi:sirohydrochlorin chelatase [Sutcliffiella halmapala]|uniref:sirohydrochlorin chelatase n=1 Tax=Sutcliffiella halmapala TaxID=79882 RepID=UPI0009958CB1|nr:sirohydrochlorin chelatase [Sutcliffiella halmapala]
MKALLYIGHGTRSKQGAAEAKQFLQAVIERIDIPIQEVSFLELTEPSIHDSFTTCVAKGAKEITLIPIFLLAAGHIKQDIPLALEPLLKKHSDIKVSMIDPFGVDDRILDAIKELVIGTVSEIRPKDSILLVGRGSSDPAIHQSFDSIIKGLGERLHIQNISVCYLAATTPIFNQAIEEMSRISQGRLIVIPYLLFSGLLLNEINLEVKKRQRQGQQIIHTGPLTKHKVIQDIVMDRANRKEILGAAINH